jgi:small ligand-binding sensory domain FIST
LTAPSAAALSRHPIAATATGEVAGALLEAVGPGADQVFLYASRHHTGTLEDVVGAVRSILGPDTLTTATTDVVIAGSQVVDDGPALAALAVRVRPGATTTIAVPGCRPIGEPMIVTAAEGDLLVDLASEPALPVLRRVLDGLEARDRALAAEGLHLGIVLDERKEHFGPGDFAVHAVRGSVAGSSVAVDVDVPVGTTVQFQVTDPGTARAELRRALAGHAACGALLLVSPDRPSPGADAAALAALVGPAVAGMSVPGEIGAASVLLFETPG